MHLIQKIAHILFNSECEMKNWKMLAQLFPEIGFCQFKAEKDQISLYLWLIFGFEFITNLNLSKHLYLMTNLHVFMETKLYIRDIVKWGRWKCTLLYLHTCYYLYQLTCIMCLVKHSNKAIEYDIIWHIPTPSFYL